WDLTRSPQAYVRGAALRVIAKFPSPEVAEQVAEFLDDNYMVYLWAADYILGSGDPRHAARAARRTLTHSPDRAARLVRTFRLREEAPLLKEWLETHRPVVQVPTAVEMVEALASLGMTEALPAALSTLSILRPQDRPLMIRAVAHLGGRAAVPALREELRSPHRTTRLVAAEALFDLGEREFYPGLARDLLDEIYTPAAARLLVGLGWKEVLKEPLARAEKQAAGGAFALWAVAARLGCPGVREPIARELKVRPDYMMLALQTAWGLPDEVVGWDGYDFYYRTVRNVLEKIERKSGRKVVLKGPVPEGFQDSVIRAGTLNEVLSALPGRWSFTLDEAGQIVVDRWEVVERAWLERLP
ncbi:MAG TPA: hypothetical protein VEN81_08575, partial [Planctomycetota bacterium]|nr:hypothetical protein [Planctomycetota bacterium]